MALTNPEISQLATIFKTLDKIPHQAQGAIRVELLLANASDPGLFNAVCSSLTVKQLHTTLDTISRQHEQGNHSDEAKREFREAFSSAIAYAEASADRYVKEIFSRKASSEIKLTPDMDAMAESVSREIGRNILEGFDRFTGQPEAVHSWTDLDVDTPPDVVDDIDYQANKPVGGHQPPASQVVGQGPSSPHPDQDPPGPGSGYRGDPVSINQVW